MGKGKRILGLAAVVALAVIGVGVWYFVIREDAPEAANIEAAGETLDQAAGDTEVTVDDLVGEWVVDTRVEGTEEFSGTWAGYRFDEELASVGATTAVGRTEGVSGTMTVTEDQVTAVEIEVDMTRLQSDQDMRDNAIRSRGLETDTFPTGTFTLTGPIDLPEGVADGREVQVTATGELTLHGVTNDVTLDMEARMEGDLAVVVGRSPVALSDYGIEPPTNASVLSVSEEGEFEFQVFFSK